MIKKFNMLKQIYVIIGVGATVVHDIPANAVVVGPEAHIIKYRE